jgi:serine phosphatase RsbU (regulator of sigma subunit)
VIREALFPTDMPEIPGICYAVDTASEDPNLLVGGDFVDVFRLDGAFAIAWGDVAGSGKEAAVTAVMAKFMLRGLAFRHPTPAATLFYLNRALTYTLEDEVFVAVVYATYYPQTRSLTVASCGSYPPLLVRAGQAKEISTPGPLVGVIKDQRYKQVELSLEAGDVLVGFTDGVVEARRGSEMFGSQRVGEIVEKYSHEREATISAMIKGQARGFGGTLADDASVFVFKVQPTGGGARSVVVREGSEGIGRA